MSISHNLPNPSLTVECGRFGLPSQNKASETLSLQGYLVGLSRILVRLLKFWSKKFQVSSLGVWGLE